MTGKDKEKIHIILPLLSPKMKYLVTCGFILTT